MLDCVRGGVGEGSGTGSAPGEGTVGVARDGGGISVTEVSTGFRLALRALGWRTDAGAAPPAGSVAAKGVELVELAPPAALGAPPGIVTGARTSPGSEGRMLGGGGRRLGGGGWPEGVAGRRLGGGGRDKPRTGGGGGPLEGRESGVTLPVDEGRGGSETGRGG